MAAHPQIPDGVSSRSRHAIADETGGIGIYGLFIFATIASVVGLSMDVANAYKVKSEMQVAVDAAAHAALVTRFRDGRIKAIDNAVATGRNDLSSSGAETAIVTSDVVFGHWNTETATFTPDSSSTEAVMVTARRNKARGNAVSTFVSSFVGLTNWEVTAAAVAETYRPSCLREGFVADKAVDIQSNNGFAAGFCIHSNAGIKINSNNTFEAGTIVSLPTLDGLQVSASGFKTNNGLLDALRESFYKIRILNRITDITAALEAGDPAQLGHFSAGGVSGSHTYLKTPGVVNVTVSGGVLDPSQLTKGRIHRLVCSGTVKMKQDATYSEVAILSPCPIQFATGSKFEDVLMVTKSTASDSFKGPSGNGGTKMNFGKDDDCADGGGVQLVTPGGIKLAAGMNVYGSQFLAAGDIQFAANADGIEGISLVSGGRIDGTSNMKMGFCGSGLNSNFEVDYYRLAY